MIQNHFSFTAAGSLSLTGIREEAAAFTMSEQLLREDVWKAFTDVFTADTDAPDAGWRGEFWGKMMRGACLIFRYRPDEALYRVLEDSVREMLKTARPDGSFNSYGEAAAFGTWDLWSRKYVLTGFLHFLEICRDKALQEEIRRAVCAHADAVLAKIGRKEDGKKEIVKTSSKWLGVNSCSILEPFVELYKLTEEARYLEFAEYIISTGGCDGGSLIEQSFTYHLPPHLLSENKAYETLSFFEGLLAYYEATGRKRYFDIVRNFADAVNDSEITVIGCCGCKHEQFDHAARVQAEKPTGIMQETCVTVTWMRLNARLFALTGEAKYLERFYLSAYNALYGALNTQHQKGFDRKTKSLDSPLPFDSYSPLYRAARGQGIGGKKPLAGIGFYGCCASIASAGVALVPLMSVLKEKNGLLLTDFFTGSYTEKLESGASVSLSSLTQMPAKAHTEIRITSDRPITLRIFIPSFVKKLSVSLNGEKQEFLPENGYLTVSGKFSDDLLVLDGAVAVRRIRIGKMSSLRCGYITLAADESQTAGFETISLAGKLKITPAEPGRNEQLRFTVRTETGMEYVLCDYASCGKRWNHPKNRVSVWFD